MDAAEYNSWVLCYAMDADTWEHSTPGDEFRFRLCDLATGDRRLNPFRCCRQTPTPISHNFLEGTYEGPLVKLSSLFLKIRGPQKAWDTSVGMIFVGLDGFLHYGGWGEVYTPFVCLPNPVPTLAMPYLRNPAFADASILDGPDALCAQETLANKLKDNAV